MKKYIYVPVIAVSLLAFTSEVQGEKVKDVKKDYMQISKDVGAVVYDQTIGSRKNLPADQSKLQEDSAKEKNDYAKLGTSAQAKVDAYAARSYEKIRAKVGKDEDAFQKISKDLGSDSNNPQLDKIRAQTNIDRLKTRGYAKALDNAANVKVNADDAAAKAKASSTTSKGG